MFKNISILLVATLASTAAFSPAVSRVRASSALKMSAADLPGALPPVGFFDPLGLSSGKTDGEIKKIREAELKHGRVAMLAFVGILVGESFNPLFDGKITGPAIYQFQQADDLVSFFWVGVLFVIALIEGQNILTGWESPTETNKRATGVAELKADYVNGDLGFDPLNLTPADSDAFNTLRTKELQNGRLAMLGVAGIVAQELVNGKGVFENFSS
jgi:light-harvesting complex I chlorophyll a/b binding protein 1